MRRDSPGELKSRFCNVLEYLNTLIKSEFRYLNPLPSEIITREKVSLSFFSFLDIMIDGK